MSNMPQSESSAAQAPPGGAPPGGIAAPKGRIIWHESPLAAGSARAIPVPAGGLPGTVSNPAADHSADAYSAEGIAQRPRTQIMLEPLRTDPGAGETVPVQAPVQARTPVPALDDPEATVPPLSPGNAGETLRHAPEDDASPFDRGPPFAPRRNMAKVWLIAALVFAAALLALTAAVASFGLPDWLPGQHKVFGEAHADLHLSFPPARQERRMLPGGAEYFGASGTITNVGRNAQHVPGLRLVLRDAGDRIVYQWDIAPPRRDLAPGESMTINEARTDVPRSARFAEIGWKPE
jgi:hypothetical protein